MNLKNVNRRQFLAMTATLGAGMALAACAPPEEAVEEEPVEEEPVEVEEPEPEPAGELSGELVFWGHDQHPIDFAAEGFVEEHPDVEWVSPHPADRGEKMTAAMAAGSGCPDLYWAEATEAQDWGCNELLTDLSEEIVPYEDEYHSLKLNETFIAKTGKHVGWPGDISVCGWYYRPDKLEEGGYEDVDFESLTYEDFCLMASDLAEQGMYSFVFPADGWNALYMIALHQLGGTAVSEDGQEITITTDEGIRAMEIVKQLWDCGGGLDVEWWSAPYWAAVQEGTLIGDFASAWARGFWEAQIESSEAGLGMWRLAQLPTGEGIQNRTAVWGGAQLVNPKCGENRENAIAFMKYALGSVEGAALAGEWGIIPGYRPYLESSRFLEQESPVFGDWPFNEFWAEQEQELSDDFYRPAGWGAVNEAIGDEMVPILEGEFTVEEGMERIKEMAQPDFDRTKCT